MRKITEIIMKGIKGQETVQKLTGKDIICGPNGAGKTTRLQALGIALTGYVPGQGKKPEETFKLSSSDSMEVGLTTNDFSFTRDFKKKVTNSRDGSTKVSIQQAVNVSPSKGETKITEKEARIMAELGNLPVMLDFNEFLSLSDTKRREFIYNLAGFNSDAWTKDKVKEYLEKALLTVQLEVNNPEQYEIMKEIIAESMKEYPESYDISTGLQSMIDWTKTKLSYWNDEKKRSQAAVQKLADLKNQLSKTDRNLKGNKEELEAFQVELIKAEKQISEDNQKKKNIDSRLEKIERIKAAMTDEAQKKCPIDVEEITKQIEAAKKKVVHVNNAEKITALHEQIKAAKEQINPVAADKEDVKTKGIEIRTQIDNSTKTLGSIKGMNHTCAIDKKIKCDKDFSKFITFTEGQINTWMVQKEILAETYKELNDKEVSLNKRVVDLQEQINSLTAEEVNVGRSNNVLISQINTLNNQLEQAKNFDSSKVQRIEELRKEWQQLTNEKFDPIAPLDILQKQVDGIRGQIEILKSKIQEQEEARITLSNLKSSMIDSKKAEFYAISFKSLDETLGAKGLQGELVKETLEPIQGDIQANLNVMGINNSFYFSTESEAGKEIFQFGWKDRFGDKRNFDALSTGQQMILLIAMMVTFIDKADPNCRILAIDNIENLDSENLVKVTEGLNKLGNKLDNIILSGVIEASDIEGYRVWNLAEEGELHERTA
ncbi:MAG: hypothetical protein AB6733_00075 [Clostridiaceae bacterium]